MVIAAYFQEKKRWIAFGQGAKDYYSKPRLFIFTRFVNSLFLGSRLFTQVFSLYYCKFLTFDIYQNNVLYYLIQFFQIVFDTFSEFLWGL